MGKGLNSHELQKDCPHLFKPYIVSNHILVKHIKQYGKVVKETYGIYKIHTRWEFAENTPKTYLSPYAMCIVDGNLTRHVCPNQLLQALKPPGARKIYYKSGSVGEALLET